jgi:phosphatidylserine decarboxylase
MIPRTFLKGRVHPAGYLIIAFCFFGTFCFWALNPSLGMVALGLTLWCLYFFRDPVRVPPVLPHVLVAPADGVIVGIVSQALPPPEVREGLEREGQSGSWTRISIFLNLFDVHVNRVPVSGKVVRIAYHPGKFLNASLDKASDLNERNTLIIDTDGGERVIVVQVAGLIARRIVCEVGEGEGVKRGDRFGIIRFGSRADVYVPSSFCLHVLKGQRTIGGETVLGSFSSKGSHP